MRINFSVKFWIQLKYRISSTQRITNSSNVKYNILDYYLYTNISNFTKETIMYTNAMCLYTQYTYITVIIVCLGFSYSVKIIKTNYI